MKTIIVNGKTYRASQIEKCIAAISEESKRDVMLEYVRTCDGCPWVARIDQGPRMIGRSAFEALFSAAFYSMNSNIKAQRS